MLEQIILGAIQGITEWLPISSEGFVLLAKVNFFGGGESVEELIRMALFFHFGTFFAALIYLHKDVVTLLKALFSYKSSNVEDRNTINFLIIATIISGALGYFIISSLADSGMNLTSHAINIVIGLLLLVTGLLGMRSKSKSVKYKGAGDIKNADGVLLGIMQGLAVLPGLSRSGLTVSSLLLRKFNDIFALRLSFLMSLPIVLAGNILLNWGDLSFTFINLWGIASAFIFGILTIHLLLKLAHKINFNYFVIGFGILLIFSVTI
jgi:undecaprenyl-diphosphatase